MIDSPHPQEIRELIHDIWEIENFVAKSTATWTITPAQPLLPIFWVLHSSSALNFPGPSGKMVHKILKSSYC